VCPHMEVFYADLYFLALLVGPCRVVCS
jgi:hypothetical protein